MTHKEEQKRQHELSLELEVDSQHFGTRLRQIRQSKGLSIEHVALKTGVSRQAISLMERCESGARISTLQKVCKSLGISMVRLFE